MTGRLVVAATPIGNLGDVSNRLVATLVEADLVYCEDTRETKRLLSALGIRTKNPPRSLHEHNEAAVSAEIVTAVTNGSVVCVVSDAGMPIVSDPGARVVAAVADAGGDVVVVPGPSAVVAALAVSGLAGERFTFEGFAPRKSGERTDLFASWRFEARTVVLFESPQRLARTLDDLARALGTRRAAICRELTKMHEEVVRGPLTELAERYANAEVRGEIVIVIEGATDRPVITAEMMNVAIDEALANGLSVRDAAERVAGDLGVSRREAYDVALRRRDDSR